MSPDPRSCGVNKRELTRSLDSRKICLTAHQLSVLGTGFETHCAEKPGSHFFSSSRSCIRLLFFSLFFFCFGNSGFCATHQKKTDKEKEENPTTARHIIKPKTTRYEFFTQGMKREQESTKGWGGVGWGVQKKKENTCLAYVCSGGGGEGHGAFSGPPPPFFFFSFLVNLSL